MNCLGFHNLIYKMLFLTEEIRGLMLFCKKTRKKSGSDDVTPFCIVDTRNVMTDYWKEHSKEPTVKEMMLDSHAEDIGKLEHPEIVSILPDLKDKDVIELGAGIG
jgi:hypothetical protein